VLLLFHCIIYIHLCMLLCTSVVLYAAGVSCCRALGCVGCLPVTLPKNHVGPIRPAGELTIESDVDHAAEHRRSTRVRRSMGSALRRLKMKKLLAIAAILLASTAAQAQYTFEYGGRAIRIDPDRGTVSIPGVYDNTGRRSKRARDQDGDKSRKQPAAQDAKADPQTPGPAPVPADQAAPPPPPAAANPPPPEAATSTANNAPADNAVVPSPSPAPVPAPMPQQDAAPVPRPAPPPTVAAVPPPSPPPIPAPAARDPNSPLGVWLTEEKEGKVRIEQCGANLCGYAVDKLNKNGE